MILNPRRIEECVDSYKALEIAKLWISGMSEPTLERRWPDVLKETEGYSHLLIVSDDAVVRQHAVDAVLELLEDHPVVTGYANLDMTDWRVNLNKAPLEESSRPEGYDFYTLGEALSYPEKAIPTTVVCFALTGMPRELWMEHGRYHASGSADFNLSKWLTGKGVPMVGAREGFIWHVKQKWNRGDTDPRKKLYVGPKRGKIRLER